MGKRGRGARRKDAPRYENGRLKRSHDREQPESATSVALASREKHAGARDLRVAWGLDGRKRTIGRADPMWGYVLGRLAIAGKGSTLDGITLKQHDVGWSFAELHLAYCHAKGFGVPNLKSPAMQMVAKGISNAPDPDEEKIKSIVRRYTEAHGEVMRHAGAHGLTMLIQVTVCDYMPRNIVEIGMLRIALNALVHAWK